MRLLKPLPSPFSQGECCPLLAVCLWESGYVSAVPGSPQACSSSYLTYSFLLSSVTGMFLPFGFSSCWRNLPKALCSTQKVWSKTDVMSFSLKNTRKIFCSYSYCCLHSTGHPLTIHKYQAVCLATLNPKYACAFYFVSFCCNFICNGDSIIFFSFF